MNTRDEPDRLEADQDEPELERAHKGRTVREHHRRAFVASIARRLNIRWSLRRC